MYPIRAAPDSSSGASSRWDELRRAKPAQPSTWDEIRDSSARAALPSSARKPASSSVPGGSYDEQFPPTPARDERQDEKTRREREFAELMDRERKGGDDSFGGDKKW